MLASCTLLSRAATGLDLKKILRRRGSIRAILSTPEHLGSDGVALLSKNRWCLPRDVAKQRLTCASLKGIWRPPPVASVPSGLPHAQNKQCLSWPRDALVNTARRPPLSGSYRCSRWLAQAWDRQAGQASITLQLFRNASTSSSFPLPPTSTAHHHHCLTATSVFPHPYRDCCYDKTTSLDDTAIVVLEFRHYHVLVTRVIFFIPPLHSHPTTARGGRIHYHPNQLPWWPLIPMSPPLPATIRIDSFHFFPLLR